MGNQNASFERLGTIHVEAFIVYVRAKKQQDQATLQGAKDILVENADHCKQKVNSKVPGLGYIIGNRFHNSMEAELLLLEKPQEAVAELQSCHAMIVYGLSMFYGEKTKWQTLWENQLRSLLDFLVEDNEQTKDNCIKYAKELGVAFDNLGMPKLGDFCIDSLSKKS